MCHGRDGLILFITEMAVSIIGAVVFIVTRQPYAGVICFALLVIKGGLLLLVK